MNADLKLDRIIERYADNKYAILHLLQDITKEYNYLPADVLKTVATKLDIPLTQLFSVATFYKSFSLKPKGKHHVCVCVGTACHVRGATRVLDKFEQELGIKSGSTTEDFEYTLETVNCLGACALGPLVTIDGNYQGKVDTNKVNKLLQKKGK